MQAYIAPLWLSRAECYRMGELGFFRGERVELIRRMIVERSPIGPTDARAVDRHTVD